METRTHCCSWCSSFFFCLLCWFAMGMICLQIILLHIGYVYQLYAWKWKENQMHVLWSFRVATAQEVSQCHLISFWTYYQFDVCSSFWFLILLVAQPYPLPNFCFRQLNPKIELVFESYPSNFVDNVVTALICLLYTILMSFEDLIWYSLSCSLCLEFSLSQTLQSFSFPSSSSSFEGSFSYPSASLAGELMHNYERGCYQKLDELMSSVVSSATSASFWMTMVFMIFLHHLYFHTNLWVTLKPPPTLPCPTPQKHGVLTFNL